MRLICCFGKPSCKHAQTRPANNLRPILTMFSLIGSLVMTFVIGAAGWFLTNFFAKPVLTFYDLRKSVHEELIFTGNLTSTGVSLGNSSDQQHAQPYRALRRFGAQLAALEVSMVEPAKSFLKSHGYDLASAASGLISLANLLSTSIQGSRVGPRNQVEVALKLPRTYSDEDIRQIGETMQARARRDHL